MSLGGADRDRTGDLMLAKHALSQLSYSPTWPPRKAQIAFREPCRQPAAEMVGLGRVELPTSPLSGVRSNQLSYRPVLERCHIQEPGGSHKTSFANKVSRTWLNVLGSYAADDHRAMTDQAKKA